MMLIDLQNLSNIHNAQAIASGGKARGLSKLLAAGFPVPPGWVVLPTAFAGDNLTAGARQQIISVITTHLAQQPDVTFAVRSSGADEDSATAAFAGVFQTILNVASPQAILEAVETVYASRREAASYRRAHGLDEAQIMAVIIQELIPADCAGVCLAVDPVALRADQLVINAAWGLGAGVMDGRVPSDTYWLETPTSITTRQQIAAKTTQLSLVEVGIGETAVPADRHRVPCLPPAWRKRIAQFTLALTRHFGQPQEVEWAIAHEQLWILQSRPQTALPPALNHVSPFPVTWEPEAARDFWQLMEYSQDQLPLPLEHDTMHVRESIREETCRIMGADRNMEMRIWNGRAYSRRLPLNITDADRRIRRAAAADLRQRLQQQGQTTWEYWGPEIISAVERLRRFDRESAAGPALADHLAEALAVLRRHASLHPRLTIKPPDSYFAAFSAVSGLKDDEAKTAAYHLLDSEENSLTRLVDSLYDLAVAARQHPTVAALVADPPPQVVAQLAALPEAKEFLQQFSELLTVYGERLGEGYGSEMSVRTPTWLEAPARPVRLVTVFLDPTIPDPADVRGQARARRDQQVTALCADCEDETAVAHFRQEWAYARQILVVLEDHNHWIEQATGGQVRLAVMAAARWLVGQNVLPEPDTIFWLTFDEILGALRTSVLETDLIAQRQTQYAHWATLTPPPILGVPTVLLPSRPEMADIPVEEENEVEDGRLHGLGASAGQVQGQVRVLSKADPQMDIQPGDILVAVNAGPLWTPFFPILGGLILEEGSLGQHAAVTAREYGIPTVIHVPLATHRLTDGEWVTVDGTNGIVFHTSVEDLVVNEGDL
ncbi:MAG: hypothetical protein CL608_28725 [Anaerolineaceae bacterium]|nr:hypothetical protein [Anaerolineaceae bacterium]